MTLDASIDAPSGEGPEPPVYGWDWTSTTHDGGRAAVRDLIGSLDPALVAPAKGYQGWSHGLLAYDAEGFKIATVYFGGREDVHLVSTSAVADSVRSTVASMHDARTARVDTRVDTLRPYDDLAEILEAASTKYGSVIHEHSSRRNRKSLGRTLYLGAPSSAIRVRLYEKWLESPGEYEPGTNRVEVQMRPASRAKAEVSDWTRAETFCASRTTQDLAERLGEHLIPTPTLHVGRAVPDLEQTLASMGKQYRRAVDTWLQATGGDIGTVLDYLCGDDTANREQAALDRAAAVVAEALG